MTEAQKAVAKKILNRLERQTFADWHEGRLDDYIVVAHPEGHPKHISKDMILQDVIEQFGIKEDGTLS